MEDISTTTTQRLLNVKNQEAEDEETVKPAPVAAAPVGAFPQGDPQGKIAPQPQGSGPANRHKLGRNDLCWCGSGKKFKKCCGA